MPKLFWVLALTAALCGIRTAPLYGGFIPPTGLVPGSQYEILFVTSGTIASTSPAIGTYNSFVTVQAGLDSSLPSTTWHAIVSTPTVNAFNNAPSSAGIPVYDTLGDLITNLGLYSGNTLSAAPDHDQNGNFVFAQPWTGSTPSGAGGAVDTAGSGTATFTGVDVATNFQWIDSGISEEFNLLPLYALSAPITVPATATPEPAAVVMLVTGLTVLGCIRVFQRRRQL